MAKNKLTALLNEQHTPSQQTAAATAPKEATSLPRTRNIHKPGEVNISAYFNPEVKAALRHVQAKTGKNIKDCLAEALQMLFRKYNVPVTIPDE
jgi:antitoxin-like ribbon-helix-helix protein